jgi:hypothetical protein
LKVVGKRVDFHLTSSMTLLNVAVRDRELIIRLHGCVYREAPNFSASVKDAASHRFFVIFVFGSVMGSFYTDCIPIPMFQYDKQFGNWTSFPIELIWDADNTESRNATGLKPLWNRRPCEVHHFRSFLRGFHGERPNLPQTSLHKAWEDCLHFAQNATPFCTTAFRE